MAVMDVKAKKQVAGRFGRERNIRHHAPANIFPDEAAAREAIRQAQAG